MYAITGASGNTGSVVVEKLLAPRSSRVARRMMASSHLAGVSDIDLRPGPEHTAYRHRTQLSVGFAVQGVARSP